MTQPKLFFAGKILALPLIAVLGLLAACTSTGDAGYIKGREIQFNVAEASGRKVTAAKEAPYEGLYENATAAYEWTLDYGDGFIRIGYWENVTPPEMLKLESDSPEFRTRFDRRITSVISKKMTVTKPAHKNGAAGLIAFGRGNDFERCAVTTSALRLGDSQPAGTFDTFVEAVICSDGILTPNTMDNLIWYLKKQS